MKKDGGTDNDDVKTITGSVVLLMKYIEENQYAGYDPYDALKSPLISKGPVGRIPKAKFLFQQLIKRFPVNLRPLLGIQKGVNPVTLGLCIQAYTALGRTGILHRDEVLKKCELLIRQLEKLIPENYSTVCWGYDFPWQSKEFHAAAFQPSVVATGIISNALFRYYHFSNNEQVRKMILSSADFVVKHLNRIPGQNGSFCFSYTPYDHYAVYNASMKAVRLLSQAASLNGNREYRELADRAMAFVMDNQNDDGSWYYAYGNKGRWIDSYHTGYVLDCAREYSELSGNSQWNEKIRSGYEYFRKHFITQDYRAAFYNDNPWPLDCTSAAQVILTLTGFKDHNLAFKCAQKTILEMQSRKGNFYFKKYPFYTRKEAFMRWSDAWMFAALSELLDLNDASG